MKRMSISTDSVKRFIPALSRHAVSRILRIYLRGPANVFAALVIAVVLFAAVFADVLASDLPIACRLHGRLHVLPTLFEERSLLDYDNARVVNEIRLSGGWALLPPIPFGPNQMKINGEITWLDGPSRRHLLGTDDSGRDILARLIHGSRTAVLVGLGSMLLGTLLGVMLGAAAAWFGGVLDRITRHSIQTFTAFPTFFLILAIQGLFGTGSLEQLVLIIAVTCWTDVARVTRAEVLRIANESYVDASRALGLTHFRILRRYMMPAVKGPMLVAATFSVAGAIVIESTLSFIGYGVPAPVASWGGLLRDAFQADAGGVLMLIPGIVLSFLVLSVNLIGEGLSEAVDRT